VFMGSAWFAVVACVDERGGCWRCVEIKGGEGVASNRRLILGSLFVWSAVYSLSTACSAGLGE